MLSRYPGSALLLLAGSCAFAQAPAKTKIYVDCTCKDQVGAQYATALRDAIARSPRYMLAFSSSEGSGKDITYNMTLSIVTINDLPDSPGVSTAISVVLEFESVMFDQHIQSCGINAVAGCAAMTLANADDDIQNLRK